VPAESNGNYADENGCTQAAPNPFLGSQRALHEGEDFVAGEQCGSERRRSPSSEGDQQEQRLCAGALHGGTRQDEAEDRPGARSPKQSRGNSEQERLSDARSFIALRLDATSEPNKGTRQNLSNAGKEKRDRENRKDDESDAATDLVGANDPGA